MLSIILCYLPFAIEKLLKLESVVVPTAVSCGGGVSHLLACRNWRLHTYLEQGLQTTGVPQILKPLTEKSRVVGSPGHQPRPLPSAVYSTLSLIPVKELHEEPWEGGLI